MNYLLMPNELSQNLVASNSIYDSTVSVGQESEHGSPGPPAKSLPMQQGGLSSQALPGGETHLQAHSCGCWQNSVHPGWLG